MKLYKLDHEILGHNFYLLPTVQIKTDYKFVKPKPTTKEDI